MIANKKEFNLGLVMMAGFVGIYVFFMTPSFGGKTLLDFMDSLYNSISKDSAYYIPATMKKAEEYNGTALMMEIKADNDAAAERIGKILQVNGMTVDRQKETLKIQGDLGQMLKGALEDADAMFKNDDKPLNAKYGIVAKQVTYDWWKSFDLMSKYLMKHDQFKESKIIQNVQTRALEPAYNYFGIQAQNIRDKVGIVVVSLAGYVVYTLWFGFSILFMFEGWGLKLEH